MCSAALVATAVIAGCTVSPPAHVTARSPSPPSATPAVPAAGQHAGKAAADGCTTTQGDLTAAMNDLHISGFSAWESSFATGDVAGGASMTGSRAMITKSFTVIRSMMTAFSSSPGLTARTVGDDLSDTGGDFEDLISGDGTVTDEATLVHTLSAAVAATERICGPSPATRYAPAQEAALDDLGTVGPQYAGDLGQLAADIKRTKGALALVEHLAAPGPQGNGGSCTVALQTGQAAQTYAGGDEDDFSQDLGDQGLTDDISGTRQAVASLQSDLGQIKDQGLTPPGGAAAAIAHAEQGIGPAITAANHDIVTENALVTDAYSVAESIAKIPSTSTANGSYSGSCRGDGPGRPVLLKHIG